MQIQPMLSYDLNLNTNAEVRRSFNNGLLAHCWNKESLVDSTFTCSFTHTDTESAIARKLARQVTDIAIAAEVDEITFVLQCGNALPVRMKFHNTLSNRINHYLGHFE